MALHRSLLAAASILGTVPVGADEPAKKDEQAKKDLEALQGTWRFDEKDTLFFHTAWVKEERFPHFDEFHRKAIEIKGDKLHYGDKQQHEITILLGTSEGKKTISFKNGDKAPIVGI